MLTADDIVGNRHTDNIRAVAAFSARHSHQSLGDRVIDLAGNAVDIAQVNARLTGLVDRRALGEQHRQAPFQQEDDDPCDATRKNGNGRQFHHLPVVSRRRLIREVYTARRGRSRGFACSGCLFGTLKQKVGILQWIGSHLCTRNRGSRSRCLCFSDFIDLGNHRFIVDRRGMGRLARGRRSLLACVVAIYADRILVGLFRFSDHHDQKTSRLQPLAAARLKP